MYPTYFCQTMDIINRKTKSVLCNRLSRSKHYDPYIKQSKIIKIFNDHGIDGLEELVPKDELMTLINERVEIFCKLWINAAALICIYHENFYLVRFLLKFIANEQLTYEDYEYEHCYLLHMLCFTDIVDNRVDYYLRQYNVDINMLDTFGRNCLFYVQVPEMYDYLISEGADKEIRDCFGYSPIFYMFVCGKEKMAMQLIDDDSRKQLAKFIVEEARTDRHIWMSVLEKVVLPTPEFEDAFIFMAIETRKRGCSTVYLKLAGIYERNYVVLMDIFDSFLSRTRGCTSYYRLEFLRKLCKTRKTKCKRELYFTMYTLDEDKILILRKVRYLFYRRWLETLVQHPDNIPKSYVIHENMVDNIDEFCEQTVNYMDYMHDVMKALDQWKFDTKYLYAMCWIYNCWLRKQEVIPYLQRLLTESESVIFKFLNYQVMPRRNNKKVEFIRFCLDNGGLPVNFQYEDITLLNYCINHTDNDAKTKAQLCELLLSYGAKPHNDTVKCYYAKLVKLLGHDVPSEQQCCCLTKM